MVAMVSWAAGALSVLSVLRAACIVHTAGMPDQAVTNSVIPATVLRVEVAGMHAACHPSDHTADN